MPYVQYKTYDITQKGRAILEKRQEELKKLAPTMMSLYDRKDTEQLYNFVVANKDWIPMMLSAHILNINDLKSVLSLLGIRVKNLGEHQFQLGLGSLGIDPLLTSWVGCSSAAGSSSSC